jgi:hypothetical protein
MGLIHKETPYPGWRALLPVAGTLMLMEGGREAWVNRKILSNPAVVWIGLISYPLYLFHWPALSFVHIVKGESPKPGYIVAALGVNFLLTILTYYFIEKKLRHNKSKWVLPALVAAFIAAGVVGHIAWRHGFTVSTDPKISLIQKALADINWISGTNTLYANDRVILNHCGGNGSQSLFFGDSNMQQYIPRISELLKNTNEKDRGALFLTCGGTPPVIGVEKEGQSQCKDFTKKYREIIDSNNNIDRVIIAALWPLYFKNGAKFTVDGRLLCEEAGQRAAIQKIYEQIHELIAKNIKVTIVMTIPYGNELDPRQLVKRGFLRTIITTPTIFTKSHFLERYGVLSDKIARACSKAGAEVIDPLKYLCTNGVCIAEDENGIPIRYHQSHLRAGYVREHVKYLDETVAP